MVRKSTLNNNHLRNWGILILSFLVSFLVVAYVARHFNRVEGIILSVGILGPLISIGLYALLSVTPIPTDSLTVINGAIFGPILGSLTSWLGNNLAATIEYFLGESIGTLSRFKTSRHKLPFGLGKFPAHSPWFLIFGRFFPNFGGKIVSVVGGLYRVPLWRYLWTAALANLWGSIMFALGGYGLVKFL